MQINLLVDCYADIALLEGGLFDHGCQDEPLIHIMAVLKISLTLSFDSEYKYSSVFIHC